MSVKIIMRRPQLYLAGLISSDFPESLLWRQRVTPKLQEAGFEIKTPLRGKTNLVKETTDGGITTSSATSGDITLRDRKDVRESDLILMHLETFGSPRGLLGTIAEAAWAFDQKTPIVGIAKVDNYLMRKHPFMVQFINHYEETEDAAVAFLIRYYGP